MKRTRILLFFLAISTGFGWFSLRKPHSPTDDLPMITVAAYEFQKIETARGRSVAEEARQWPGVTAATFNEGSQLLGVTFTGEISEKNLLEKLGAAAAAPVARKVFTEPTGAKCPVPTAVFAKIPIWLGWLSGLFSMLLLLTFLSKFFRKKEKSLADRQHESAISNHLFI